MIIYGDLGLENGVSIPRIAQEVDQGNVDLIFHAGNDKQLKVIDSLSHNHFCCCCFPNLQAISLTTWTWFGQFVSILICFVD